MGQEMPRPSKGPRLYLKRRKGREAVWVIRDGAREIGTGCGQQDVDGARERLAAYLQSTFRPDTGERNLSNISCAEVLMLYFRDLPDDSPTKKTIGYHIKALNPFWGAKSLADVKGSTCRSYLTFRTLPNGSVDMSNQKWPNGVKPSTARQELKTFQAAINHWHRESPLEAVPKVTLPKSGERRERVLERSEVARMLWACRKLSKTPTYSPNGAQVYRDYGYVARFILIGLYTGTRHDAILKLNFGPSLHGGHADLNRGVRGTAINP